MHVQRSQVWMRKNPSGGGNEKACYLDSWNRVYPILHLFFFFFATTLYATTYGGQELAEK